MINKPDRPDISWLILDLIYNDVIEANIGVRTRSVEGSAVGDLLVQG